MYTSTGRTNARHHSRTKEGKITQSPQINTVTDPVASSGTPNDSSCDLAVRETDIDMLENNSADQFSPFSQSDDIDDGEDSGYVPESDSEVGFLITVHPVTFLLGVEICVPHKGEPQTGSRPRSHSYFLRNTVQREARLQLEASADTSKARRAVS